MKLRHKTTKTIWYSTRLNVHSQSELLVVSDDDADSDFIRNYEVELGLGEQVYWKDLQQAFVDRDLITDNHATYFFEPRNSEDKGRGYTLE